MYNASVADETIKILQLESQQKDKMITDLTSECKIIVLVVLLVVMTDMIIYLVEKYQMTLNKSKMKIEEMSSEEDNRVDK